jgi:hypothetical protein
MPSFAYVGRNGEHIVGLAAGDLTADQYDALSDSLKQAVYENRGSDGQALYAMVAPDYENPAHFDP